jgi:hypothetical protein
MSVNNIYKDYNGLPCVSRRIDSKNWTWIYIYENKLAKKNKAKYDTLNKSYNSLIEKENKNKEVITECVNKFYDLTANEFATIEDFCENVVKEEYDNVKGIVTLRNKVNKVFEQSKEISCKKETLQKEMTQLIEFGFDEYIEVPTNEMVYAYDMRNYVRLHPEEFKK